MASIELVTFLSVLQGGRTPSWCEQTDQPDGSGNPSFTGAPSSAGSGVSLQPAGTISDGASQGGALWSILHVQLREDVSKRTARVTALHYVNGETYTITIGGNAVAVVGGATWADCVVALVAALPGVPAAALLVTFTAVDADGDGTVDTLLIRGKAEAGWSLGLTTTGAATMLAAADPASCTARAYWYCAGSAESSATLAPSGWGADAANTWTVTYRGLNTRCQTGGRSRAYCELSSLTGDVGDAAAGANVIHYYDVPTVSSSRTGARVFWGPAVDE